MGRKLVHVPKHKRAKPGKERKTVEVKTYRKRKPAAK